MKHMPEALLLIETLTKALQTRGLRQGKAFRRHCARLTNAAAYRDLEDIHREVNVNRQPTWGDMADRQEAA